MFKPKFSVVIPTYNRLELLKIAIDSVVKQTFHLWELIIVDNNSDDATQEYLNSISSDNIKWVNNDIQRSIARSRNIGVFQSSGDWIAFLDSDDFWHSEKLQRVDELTEFSDVIYHDAYILDESKESRGIGNLGKQKSRTIKDNSYRDLLLNGNCIVNSSAVVRKTSLIDIQGFNESSHLFAIEDYDCWLRLAKANNRFLYLAKPLVTYRIHSSNAGKVNNLDYLKEAISEHLDNLGPVDLKRFESLYEFQVMRRNFREITFKSLLKQAVIPFLFGQTFLKLKIVGLIVLSAANRLTFGFLVHKFMKD